MNESYSAEHAPSVIDLGTLVDDIFKSFIKMWWLLLAIISVCATLFYVRVKIIYQPEYTASATYIVSSDYTYGYSGNSYNQTIADGLATTLQYIFDSDIMKSTIAEDLGTDSIPGTLSVSVVEDTNMFTISATASEGQLAYDILQSAIESYPSIARYIIGSTSLEVMEESGIPYEASNVDWSKGAAKTGMVVGVVIDFFVLLFFALTKRTIRKVKDFEKLLNIRCVAAVPKVKFKKRGKKTGAEAKVILIDNFRVPSGFVEAMRSVRRRIEDDYDDNNHKVYLVTSALPSEGKSTIASNIALSLALKGKSVILADMDLRNPSVADTFNMKPASKGTVDVLRQTCSLERALVKYEDTQLSILPGGKAITRPARVLTSENAKEFIESLKKKADYVILDTPPCALLSDAMLTANGADAGIFVVRQDYARIDKIIEGIENLSETGIDILGCLLNNAEVGVTQTGYGQGYGYGRYGYGRGDSGYGYNR